MPDPIVSAFDATPRTRLVFGPGTVARLGALAQELGSTRALIVTDLGIIHAGHAQRARSSRSPRRASASRSMTPSAKTQRRRTSTVASPSPVNPEPTS